jgi:hypothetical protein
MSSSTTLPDDGSVGVGAAGSAGENASIAASNQAGTFMFIGDAAGM